jgi:hypothetical protein
MLNNIQRFLRRLLVVMILVRFAISIFALSLLGMALSLSSAHSQQPVSVPTVTLR